MHAREARLHASVRTPFCQVQKATPPAGDDASAHGHAANEPPKGAKKVQKAAPDKTRTVTADTLKKGITG
ncbi:hypothetical protein M885DRAFT_560070 [Pelagophyceae sp. CCMP2097]|nr:hypothetical protein M885DRAFT_560070 [Pelagophyceae sp. CCMP2097]